MTNTEIIETELMLTGNNFPYDGSNLLTYAEWQKKGFQVQKGEKAFIQVSLWMPFESKNKKDNNSNKKSERKFFLKKSSLFTPSQVKPIEEKSA